MKRFTDKIRYLMGGGLLLLTMSGGAAEPNVRLHGALVAEPCVIPPGEEDITLDFSGIVDKYLYLNKRTPGQPFGIHLTECDLNLGTMVSVTFGGVENSALSGLLAIDGGSEAKGIALGLETVDGQPLPLNKASEKISLQDGNNVIAFKVYVRGEPSALANQNIERGTFTATATFSLDYE